MAEPNQSKRFIPTAGVRARYGDVSQMWPNRRVQETLAALQELGLTEVPADNDQLFPLPIYISGRRYWDETQLDRYDRGRVRFSINGASKAA